MSSMIYPTYSFSYGGGSRRLSKVAVVVGLHAVLFFLAKEGMLHRMVDRIPEVVNVKFVTPPTPPAPPAPPKMVEISRPNVITPVLPQLPIVIENAITLPPPVPRTNESVVQHVSTPVSAPAAPAPAAPVGPRVVSGVEYVRAPQPVYPTMSRRMGEQGVVMLRVLVNEKGQAEQANVQKSSGFDNLDEAGRQAALKALFKPYIEDGKAIQVYVIVPINFRIS